MQMNPSIEMCMVRDCQLFSLKKQIHCHFLSIDFLTNIIIPAVPNNSCPPFPVLIYAIRNIIEPTFLVAQIPDLLVLIAHANIIRKHAISKARKILSWNDHYKRHPQRDIRTLAEKDRQLLETFTLESDKLQKMYRKIVNGCFQIDIYHLFFSPQSYDLWPRLQMYFPGQFDDDPDSEKRDAHIIETRAKHLFHYDMTDEEQQGSRVIGVYCAQFVRDASKFMQDPEAFRAQVG
ncbi:hypothetical protein AcV5_002560 [Taiwanofungus camphoratus]|nr:hypothetical protein AcV5_002560 [Antrodia cinnamomea]